MPSDEISSASFRGAFCRQGSCLESFGTGIGSAMGWKDIDVHRKVSGEPFVVLAGGAKKIGEERGVISVWITLSHTEHHAMAMIVVESEGGSGAPRTMAADDSEAASI